MKNNLKKRHPQKKRMLPIYVIIPIILVSVLLLVGIGGVSFVKLYRPNVDTDIPFDTAERPPSDSEKPIDSEKVPDKENPPEADETTEPEVSVGSFERDMDSVNFLVVGQDVGSFNTDVIMLVNFNMREGDVSVMQFPRDTYIEADDKRGRINAAMSKYYNAAKLSNRNGKVADWTRSAMASFCEMLEKSMCIQIDGYVHMNLEGFRNIVNAIGGVYMNVPADMDYDDPVQNLSIHLKAGWQLLDGKHAEMFVRFREGYVQADIGRMDAQKLFLTALFKQLKSSLNVSTVAKLAEQVYKYVLTDVPLTDIIIYAKELLGVDMSAISMMTLHGTATQTETGAWYYIMNRAAALEMVNGYFNVYNSPITDKIFDPDYAFTNEDSKIFTDIYLAPADSDAVEVTPGIQTGDTIDSDGLDIYYKD